MFWATVILSAGALSGPMAGQTADLRPELPPESTSTAALMERAGEAAQGRQQAMALEVSRKSKNPAGLRIADGSRESDFFSAATQPEEVLGVSMEPRFGAEVPFSDLSGFAPAPENGFPMATDPPSLPVAERYSLTAPSSSVTILEPGLPLEWPVSGTKSRSKWGALNRNTVARLPWPGTLAFKPQIERLCRYVEEQSRRGPTAVGHEKTHPRSERSGDLPSAGDSDQFRKRGSSPFLSKELAGGSSRLRSVSGFGALYSVREALSVYGEARRSDKREAAPGNRKPQARKVSKESFEEEWGSHGQKERLFFKKENGSQKEISLQLSPAALEHGPGDSAKMGIIASA
tara:strand:+ start:35583 stop:36620 length:1038 start_codon:yes stop_codon:yes gene_type:complete